VRRISVRMQRSGGQLWLSDKPGSDRALLKARVAGFQCVWSAAAASGLSGAPGTAASAQQLLVFRAVGGGGHDVVKA